MTRSLRPLWFVAAALSVCLLSGARAQAEEWVSLFDGKTLDGWEKQGGNDNAKWEVIDGAMCGSGQPSMLWYSKKPFKNFRYRCEVKINDGGNSGLYFRTKAKPGFVDGYEAQIDSTHTDKIRTGSLYGMCHVYRQLQKPDEWFKYEIQAQDGEWRGRKCVKIKVSINGEELYEYLDFANTFKEGYFAFQQHDPGSKVCIKNIEVMELPEGK